MPSNPDYPMWWHNSSVHGEVSVADLRDVISEKLELTIESHRRARSARAGEWYEHYEPPPGPPTDEEVNDVIALLPHLESWEMETLMYEGFNNYRDASLGVTPEWVLQFETSVEMIIQSAQWQEGDLPWDRVGPDTDSAKSELWLPDNDPEPSWLRLSPSYLFIAADLLRSGRLLNEMGWRDFEVLIAELLEHDGWKVELTGDPETGGWT